MGGKFNHSGERLNTVFFFADTARIWPPVCFSWEPEATVNLRRLIQPSMVRLRLETPVPEPLEGEEGLTPRQITGFKEEVLGEIAELFEASGQIDRVDKLHRELTLREGKASTAVGRGIAFPHIKTLRTREMICAIALAPEGIPFDEPDGEPVRLIVGIVSGKNTTMNRRVQRFDSPPKDTGQSGQVFNG